MAVKIYLQCAEQGNGLTNYKCLQPLNQTHFSHHNELKKNLQFKKNMKICTSPPFDFMFINSASEMSTIVCVEFDTSKQTVQVAPLEIFLVM